MPVRSHSTLDENTLQTAISIAASAADYPAIGLAAINFSHRGGFIAETLDVLDRIWIGFCPGCA